MLMFSSSLSRKEIEVSTLPMNLPNRLKIVCCMSAKKKSTFCSSGDSMREKVAKMRKRKEISRRKREKGEARNQS